MAHHSSTVATEFGEVRLKWRFIAEDATLRDVRRCSREAESASRRDFTCRKDFTLKARWIPVLGLSLSRLSVRHINILIVSTLPS